MTASQLRAAAAPAAGAPAAGPGRAVRQRPVVVLAYAYSGAARIQRLLARSTVLACTSGTGLLPLCAQAAAAWRRVDDRDGPLSPLAVSSIRALAASMITAILADAGRSRWCEISFSPPAAAEAFLQLYPGTKFICLHRSCPDVIRAGVEANPWGLAGTSLGPFTSAYPGSSAAAIAAYWAECAQALLRFEEAHPGVCRRVRYEELADYPDPQTREIFAFLELDAEIPCLVLDATISAPHEEAGPGGEPGAALAGVQVPSGHLPAPLRERVNDLQALLGYAPIA
jgi:Sulfotransferase family